MAFRLRPSVTVSHAYVLECPVAGQDGSIFEIVQLNSEPVIPVVACKGKIVYTAIVTLGGIGVTEFNIMATADMTPMCSVVAFFIYKGEVIADYVGIRISGIFRNEVTNTFSTPEQDAGKDVSFTVGAEPNSTVYLLAIDKTVLQLAEANDITEEMVEDYLGAFGMKSGTGPAPIPPCCGGGGGGIPPALMPPWFPSFPGNTDKLITDAGLIYLTDLSVFKQKARGLKVAFMGPVAIIEAQTSKTTVEVRKDFPETWLWTEEVIGANGQITLDVTLPDTVTTWIATSFAMHPTAGLGITAISAEVIGSLQFFLYPNLPPSLVRGESLHLPVSVFNYLKNGANVQATVQIVASPEWYSVSGPQTIVVLHGGAATATFKLTPRKAGRMPIKIVATTPSGQSDSVIRYIRVFPEGKQITGSKNYLLKLSATNPQAVATHRIEMPELIVTDSKYVKVTVTGNVMGPTIEGLESLVQRPVGCGEQNMITLVPNIYVRDLLESTNKITPDIKEKTTRHMHHGILRELVFQRTDGSFSAFKARPSDLNDHGSTWLTAFVMQSFIESMPYVTVDPQIIQKGLHFIVLQQNQNGLFKEPGRVIHREMQGGTAGGMTKTMAAYMLITMVMARDHVPNLGPAIAKTQTLLEANNPEDIDDPYMLAISAYALQLAGSSSAGAFIARLHSLAINDGDGRHWEVPATTTTTAMTMIHRRSSGPSDVEMSAYVLKTYVLRGELVEGAKVMKWLAEQRNPNGGFHSTQDTVLALGAMTAFYKKTYNTADLNVEVDITIDGVTQRRTITEANAELVQAFEMDNPVTNDISINANGVGDIFVQISWSYYVDGNIEIIDIQHDILPVFGGVRRKRATNGGVIDMELCLKLTENVQDMPICEFTHPSGYGVSMGIMDQYVDATEVTTKTVFYFSQLPANYSSCSRFQFIKEINVENLKPSNSICYFYYQSGSGSSKLFTMDPPNITGTPSVPSTSGPRLLPPGFILRFFMPFLSARFLFGDTDPDSDSDS